MVANETKIKENFPFPELTKIFGRPIFSTVNHMLEEMCENAATIKSALGGGVHGPIGLFLPDVVYATHSAVPFVIPPRPNPAPALAGLAAAQARQEVVDHAVAVLEYSTLVTFTNMTKSMMIAAIDPVYLKPLRQPIVGYRNVSIRQFFTYLMSTYGRLTPVDAEIA